MRKALTFFSILMIYSSCSNKYNLILDGLSKNNVLLYEEMGKEYYLESFNVSEKDFDQDLQEYENSLDQFFNSEKEIILYLLNFKNDTLLLCDWIKTKHPYSSTLQKGDFFTKSEGAIILIDNYLNNTDAQRIIIPEYYERLKFDIIEKFYLQNKKMNKRDLQIEYNKLVNNIIIYNSN